MIELKGVSFRYPDSEPVLKEISFDVAEKEKATDTSSSVNTFIYVYSKSREDLATDSHG